jgi:hypothetical protein
MTHSRNTHNRNIEKAKPKKRRSGGHVCRFLAAVLAFTVTAAHAEVRVSGDASALRVDAGGSNVAEVLAALESAVQIRVSSSVIVDRPVAGTFTGSLGQVLTRVLDGYNYVIRRQDTLTEVKILGARGERAVAVDPPTPPAARSHAAEWRGLANNNPSKVK